jgi:hypothetical protein
VRKHRAVSAISNHIAAPTATVSLYVPARSPSLEGCCAAVAGICVFTQPAPNPVSQGLGRIVRFQEVGRTQQMIDMGA